MATTTKTGPAKAAGKPAPKPPVQKTAPKLTPASQKAVDGVRGEGKEAVIKRLLKLEAEVKELKDAAKSDERAAVQAAAEWQRSASDPERVRRQAEYLAARQRKAAKPPNRPAASAAVGDDLEAIRAEALRKLRDAS